MPRLTMTVRRHWFVALLPILLLTSYGFGRTHDWTTAPRMGEAATLFDWCLFVPLLFVVCYRHLPPRVLLLRTLALVCSGIWIAAFVVPDAAETILPELRWARWGGIAILIAVELAVVVAAVRLAFGKRASADALERLGIPAFAARLMLLEARLWTWVYRRLTGRGD